MSTSPILSLEEAIRDAGEGWLIDQFESPDQAIDHIEHSLATVQREATRRLAGAAPDFSPAALIRECQHNRSRIRGFIQALGGTRSPQMLLMAWRVLQGMQIKDVQIRYRRQESFHMRVVLESPYGEEDAPYESDKIQDFVLFRHVGVLEIGDRPVFDGFYALKLPKS